MKTMTSTPSTTTAKPTAGAKSAKSAKSARAAKANEPALAQELSDEARIEILNLGKGSNSIELKLSVPATGHRATIKSIGLDPVEAQPRQAFFFDTPELDLYRAGVVVRARRIQGGDGDTVIKLRPVEPSAIDPQLRRSASFKIEVDVMPGGFVCSASFKGVCTGQEVLDLTSGTLPLRKLFSKGQRAFYDAHAPAEITMDKLVILGPIFLLKARHQAKDFDRPLTIEMWLYPDGSRILEISTKCLPREAFQVAAEFRAYLARHGIALVAEQSPKTKTSLEFFSARLNKEELAG